MSSWCHVCRPVESPSHRSSTKTGVCCTGEFTAVVKCLEHVMLTSAPPRQSCDPGIQSQWRAHDLLPALHQCLFTFLLLTLVALQHEQAPLTRMMWCQNRHSQLVTMCSPKQVCSFKLFRGEVIHADLHLLVCQSPDEKHTIIIGCRLAVACFVCSPHLSMHPQETAKPGRSSTVLCDNPSLSHV